MQPKDGLPKDQMENVWHFSSAAGESSPATLDEATACASLIENFYNVAGPGSSYTIAQLMSPTLAPACVINIYDEAATKPRPIFQHSSFELVLGSGTVGLPEEVALCISYYAVRNIARHRGRLYLGPFATVAGGGSDPGDNPSASRPSNALLQAIASAGEALLAAETSVVWCVRSGLGAGSVAAPVPTYYPTTDGWVDNEWDAQRRRRVEATSRLAFTATGTG